jgi:hypothetical protein
VPVDEDIGFDNDRIAGDSLGWKTAGIDFGADALDHDAAPAFLGLLRIHGQARGFPASAGTDLDRDGSGNLSRLAARRSAKTVAVTSRSYRVTRPELASRLFAASRSATVLSI